MLISENAVNMLAAKFYKGIGRKWINDNLAGSPSVERIVRLLGEKIEDVSVYDFEARKRNIRQRIEALGGAIVDVIVESLRTGGVATMPPKNASAGVAR